ncbi:NAD(P)-binding domain-containing protein [Atopobacter sp. AH10]|uniref:NAD(P)-binding domain-containing protein n=1 Tax=Atopobacter sp. AH10 TaxID=2315861 RepID=UPI001F19F769|nr:NAD(P)-binding domain-containing protein [Atopobacter sp. AH10]
MFIIKKAILIIGYGVMTKGIIKNLLQSDRYDIFLYSRHLEYSESVSLIKEEELGSKLACVDIVITCFRDSNELSNFINDKLAFATFAHQTTVVDFTTLKISDVKKYKECVEARGACFVEAPVTGSKLGSESGNLSIFLYMEKEKVKAKKEVMQVLELISKNIYIFEKSTEPTRFKLLYNAWGAYILYSLKLFNPRKYGFSSTSLELAKKIVCSDGWMSLVCDAKLDQMDRQDFDDIHFKIDYMVKDLEYANTSVFHRRLREINYLVEEYKNALHHNAGRDFTAIGREYDE